MPHLRELQRAAERPQGRLEARLHLSLLVLVLVLLPTRVWVVGRGVEARWGGARHGEGAGAGAGAGGILRASEQAEGTNQWQNHMSFETNDICHFTFIDCRHTRSSCCSSFRFSPLPQPSRLSM